MSSIDPSRREQKVDTRAHRPPSLPEQTAIVPVAAKPVEIASSPTVGATANAIGGDIAPASPLGPTRAEHQERGSVAKDSNRSNGLVAVWIRATLALAGAGSALALGTRALFERLVGAVPYEMPSTVDAVSFIVLASGAAAAFAAWSSESADDTSLTPPSGKFRRASMVSAIVVGGLLLLMLQGAHDRANELSTLTMPGAPLAAVEHRAQLRPGHAASQLALGESYFRLGRYADALGPLEMVGTLTVGPDDFRTMHYADRTWQERVVPAKPTYARATVLYTLARAHLASSDAAIVYYRQAYEIGEHSREVTQPLVDALMKEQRYIEAGDVMRRYMADNGNDPDLERVLAAADAAQHAIEVEIQRTRAPLPFPSNDLIRRWQDEVRRNPRDAFAESRLADALGLAVVGNPALRTPANLEVAATHLRRAIVLAPRAAYYRAQLGMLLTLEKRYQAADSAFAAALALDPSFFDTNPAFRDTRATAHLLATGHTPGEVMLRFLPPREP